MHFWPNFDIRSLILFSQLCQKYVICKSSVLIIEIFLNSFQEEMENEEEENSEENSNEGISNGETGEINKSINETVESIDMQVKCKEEAEEDPQLVICGS
jgi:hypothetical protein